MGLEASPSLWSHLTSWTVTQTAKAKTGLISKSKENLNFVIFTLPTWDIWCEQFIEGELVGYLMLIRSSHNIVMPLSSIF